VDPERTRLWEPTFVVDYPVDISPLAKAHPDRREWPTASSSTRRGWRIANGFSELNDPLEQRRRFLDQLRERERATSRRTGWTRTTCAPSGTGLPPTGGCGVGIDRLP